MEKIQKRIKSMRWWNAMTVELRQEIVDKDWIIHRTADSLTGRDIEALFVRLGEPYFD